MAKRKFKVMVNTTWCKGCNLCVYVCPKKVLILNDRVKCDPVRPDDCIGCQQCEFICPDLAITVQKDEGGEAND